MENERLCKKFTSGGTSVKKFQGIIIFILIFSFAIATFWLHSRTAANAAGLPELKTTFDIPTAVGKPLNLTIQSDGSTKIIWFTLPEEDALGELIVTNSTTFNINKYNLSANSEPYDLVFDGTNTIWFTLKSGDKLGQINVNTKAVTEIAIPGGNEPVGIDMAPNGTLWFAQKAGNKLTQYNPSGGGFTDFNYTTANGQLEEVDVLNNDKIWASAPGANRLTKLTPSMNDFSNVPLQILPGSPPFPPSGLVLDNAEPWASSADNGLIGRHAPGTLSFWIWYALEIGEFAPTKLAYQNEGANRFVWFVDPTNGLAGRIRTDNNGQLQDFYYTGLTGGATAVPTDIDIDSNDTVWIANNGTGEIVQWNAPHFDFTYLPALFRN